MTLIAHEALLLDDHLNLTLGHRDAHSPSAGEALVRLEWAGVCGSDLHVLRTGDWVTDWPATLGHEAVGTVISCPGGEIAEGALVVLDSRMPCGVCQGCNDAPNLCESMRWLGEGMPGGFQRQGVFRVEQLVACPDGMESAVAVLAEPLAVAMHAVNRAGSIPDRVLVLGYGPVGALVHAEIMRRHSTAEVTVVEPHQQRQQMALAAGARVAPTLPTGLWPWVVDAAGYAASLPDAIAHTRPGGTVMIVALAHEPVTVLPQVITERALTLVGSNGFNNELPASIAALHEQPDAFRWLITEAVLLEEAAERLTDLTTTPSAGKVVIRL